MLVGILNGYFERMSQAITQHRGYISTFIGDGILALFGALSPNPWQGNDAVHAALAMRKALEAYNPQKMLGIVMDLRCRSEGIVIDFLGRPARTFAGPVRLAARTGAVVLPMACWMIDGNRYRIVIDEPVPVAAGPLAEERLEESTRECLRSLERFIREAPTQWVWMHDRWNAGAA